MTYLDCIRERQELQHRYDELAAEYASEVLRLTDEVEAVRDERDVLLAEREALLDELESFNGMLHGIGIALADHPSVRHPSRHLRVVPTAEQIKPMDLTDDEWSAFAEALEIDP